MKRRDLLHLLSLILAGQQGIKASLAHAATHPASDRRKVLVVGAGIAGLSAARQLTDSGFDVQVIEGRNRIGGRLWTSTHWPDIPLDLGASWIHGLEGNPITKLAESIDAKLVTTQYGSSARYNTDGKLLTEIQDSQLLELRKKLRRAIKKAQEVNHDSPLQQVVDGLGSESSTTAEIKRFTNFIVSSEIEQEYSGSVRRLSTHWYDSDESYEGDDALFREGYRVIVDYLARDLTIQTGEVVDEINWKPGGVRIVTSAKTYHADHCVVTLPLGVLKAGTVRFVPELPSSTQKAIAGLEMGVLNKCCLRFEKAFWPKDVDWIEYIPEHHGEWAEWVSLVRACGEPILVGFNAADRGREIESWSDQQIVANAMKTLRTIFGRETPDPIDFQITRWAKDPFSMGSYSYNPFGSSPRSRLKLSQALNNTLFFAGEATEAEYFGTVHGAYLSGLRAASEITSFDLK